MEIRQRAGSLIGNKEDVEHRKQLKRVVMNKLNHIWIRMEKNKTRGKNWSVKYPNIIDLTIQL